MKLPVNGEPPRTAKFMVIDMSSREWADDTFTRREAAIEKAEEALKLIRQVESTLREAADFLDQHDPLMYRILSYPMSWDATEGYLREEIAEWKKDQDELESEIRRYDAARMIGERR